jgi:hypothetical protein
MKVYIVIGHLTPTDGNPDPDVQGKLDEDVSVMLTSNGQEAMDALLWYQDGIIRELTIDEG